MRCGGAVVVERLLGKSEQLGGRDVLDGGWRR